MSMVFRADDLQVTDDWIRCATGTFAIRDVRNAWVSRRTATRGNRFMTAALGVTVLLVIIGGAGVAGALAQLWIWVLALPAMIFIAAWLGLLDPIAIYLEKRHHELWISTDVTTIVVWRANAVEVHKALRAIQRARERERESRQG